MTSAINDQPNIYNLGEMFLHLILWPLGCMLKVCLNFEVGHRICFENFLVHLTPSNIREYLKYKAAVLDL